jgi:hypothetical protein
LEGLCFEIAHKILFYPVHVTYHLKLYRRLRLGVSQFQATPCKKFGRPDLSGKKLGMVGSPYHPSKNRKLK